MTIAPSKPIPGTRHGVTEPAPSAPSAHGIHTVLADDLRAVVQVTTEPDARGVAALEATLAEHCARGRRYLRISIAGLHRLDPALITLLERTHYRLLAARGTCIITGAGPAAMRTLRELGLDDVLLVVEAFASERGQVPSIALAGG